MHALLFIMLGAALSPGIAADPEGALSGSARSLPAHAPGSAAGAEPSGEAAALRGRGRSKTPGAPASGPGGSKANVEPGILLREARVVESARPETVAVVIESLVGKLSVDLGHGFVLRPNQLQFATTLQRRAEDASGSAGAPDLDIRLKWAPSGASAMLAVPL